MLASGNNRVKKNIAAKSGFRQHMVTAPALTSPVTKTADNNIASGNHYKPNELLTPALPLLRLSPANCLTKRKEGQNIRPATHPLRALWKQATPILYLTVMLIGTPAYAQELGPQLSSTTGHVMGISSLTWSEGDDLVLTASADNSVKLWQATTGTVIRTFIVSDPAVRGVRASVQGAAMSSGAKLVAVASDDGLRLWNGRTGAQLQTLEATTRFVKAVAMNQSGTLVVAAGADDPAKGAKPFLSVHRRDVAGNWRVTSVPLHVLQDIDEISLANDGRTLALAGSRITRQQPGGVETAPFFAVWEIGSDKPLNPVALRIDEGEIPDTELVGFSKDASVLFIRERDSVYRVEIATMRLRKFCVGWRATLSQDGGSLAVAPGDSSNTVNAVAAEILDTRIGDVNARVPWPDQMHEETKSRVATLAVSESGNEVIVALNSGKLARWDQRGAAYRWIVQPRNFGPRALNILDNSGRRLLLANGEALRVFDLGSGRQRILANPRKSQFDIVVMSGDGHHVAAAGSNSGLHLWDSETGELKYSHTPMLGGISAIAFSPDGQTIAQALGAGKIGIARVSDGSTIGLIKLQIGASALAYFPDGKMLAAGDELGEVHFLPLDRGRSALPTLPAPGVNASVSSLELDAAGAHVAAGYGNGFNRSIIYDLGSGKSITTERQHGWVNAIAFDKLGKRIVTVGQDQRATVWNASTGKEIDSVGHQATVQGVGLSDDGRKLATVADGAVHLWLLNSAGHLERIANISDIDGTNWVVIADDGRFDTGDPEALRRISWLMPDDPLRPLAVDTYMRDFYEPRLLPRLLACHDAQALRPEACRDAFTPIRSLGELNRVVPHVGIVRIEEGSFPDQVIVQLTAESAEDPTQTNHKFTTEAFDLRLFRDGQLVGRCPKDKSGPVTSDDCLRMTVRLGHHEGLVRFTAYAFNEDRVRSSVAEYTIVPSPSRTVRRPRAYIVAIGVNAYAGQRGTLTYAAKDARDIAQSLKQMPGFEVVPVTLLSETSGPRDATLAKIGGVLDLLAGKAVPRGLLTGIDGTERFERAEPDDVVVISFSGHGYTAPNGEFFLLSADSEAGVPVTPQLLQDFISSDQLQKWLAPIDAGQITLIIDACHSAASVKQPGFKPGPMGDRGLGQLAYDKGMRILAATQADEVAIETAGLQQGLLTFALVQRGLGADGGKALADADGNGEITMAEWLDYGATSTSGLYKEALAGKIRLRRRDAAPDPQFISLAADQGQTPEFFNYYRGRDALVLRRAQADNDNLHSRELPDRIPY